MGRVRTGRGMGAEDEGMAPAKVEGRTPEAAEANEVARELAASRERYHRWYASAYDIPPKESLLIDEEWQRDHAARILASAEDTPADLVNWWDIDHLTRLDPERGEELWRRVRQEAREEVEDGFRAARLMEPSVGQHGPWDRARFLALRDAMREEWRPRVGVESSLVDMLAQIHTLYEAWLGKHVHRMTFTGVRVTREEARYRMERGEYVLPRVEEHEELEQTAAMADRWQKAYLRTVRALRDLRRHSGVVIQNAGQVNIGEQQVNVTDKVGI